MRRASPPLPGLALAALFACHSGTATQAPTSDLSGDVAGDKALEGVSAEDLRKHVEILASDEYAGRATLTPGYEKAASYIAREFAAYGLAPMPGQSDFVVPYKLWRTSYDKATSLAIGTTAGEVQVELGVQAKPFALTDEGSVDGDIIFAGYSITAPELGYDDYTGLDVKDKWVLVLRHAPGHHWNKESPFYCKEDEDKKDAKPEGDKKAKGEVISKSAALNLKIVKTAKPRRPKKSSKDAKKDANQPKPPPDPCTYASFRSKLFNAQEHGARGLLLVNGPATTETPEDMRLRNRLRVPLTPEEKAEEKAKRAARLKAQKERIAAAKAKAAAQAKKGVKRKKRAKARKAKKKTRMALAKAPVEEKKLVVFFISPRIAAALIASTGKSLAKLQKLVDTGTPARDIKLQASAKGTIKTMKDPATVTGKNIIAYLEGSDPALKDELVVIGGHFDHLGAKEVDADAPGDIVYNGADDNASGTSGVLELAQAFATARQAPRRSLLFMAFSGEERGLLGSRALVKQGPLQAERVAFMLNLDMIGRNSKLDRPKPGRPPMPPTPPAHGTTARPHAVHEAEPHKGSPVEFVGSDHATQIRTIAETANADIGLELEFGEYAANSDHHSFFNKEVPVAFFFTGLHEDYHGLADHTEKLDYERMEKIVKLGYELASGVANGDERPTFIHKLGWLGASVLLDEAPQGSVARIVAMETDSRAAEAGLQVGDTIGKIGEAEVQGGKALNKKSGKTESAGAVLGDIDPGTKFELGILREGQVMSIALERAKRGYLGIMPGRLSEEKRQQHSLDESEGVLIGRAVKDAPAAKSGLRDGDIITKLAGHSVNNRSLMKRLRRIGAGETITVQIIRDGKRIEMPLVLGEPPTRGRR